MSLPAGDQILQAPDSRLLPSLSVPSGYTSDGTKVGKVL